MKDIHIGPRAQLLALLGIAAALAGAVAKQLPEVRRYLKIRSM